MKKWLLALSLVMLAPVTWAQTTTITASHIDYFGGAPVTGQMCLSPTDQYGNPINLTTSTGQQFPASPPLCFTVTAGVLASGATVPDTSTTQPRNPCYAVKILNAAGATVGKYSCIQPTGATWNFDSYIPGNIPTIPYYAGTQGPPGPAGPTGPQGPAGPTTQINSTDGPFTFAGAGVSQSGSTFTFSGSGTPPAGATGSIQANGGSGAFGVATSAQIAAALNTSPSTQLVTALIPALPYLPTSGGTLTGALNAPTVNAVVNAALEPGATADVKIANACAALPSGGGTIDARGFGATTQTIAATVQCGDSAKPVTMLFDPATIYQPATASVNMFQFSADNTIRGLNINAANQTAYSGNAISNAPQEIYSASLSDILINLPPTSTGSCLSLNGTSGSVFVEFSSISNLSCYAGTAANGIVLENSNGGWINSNHFIGIRVYSAKYGIEIDQSGSADIAGNIFTDYEYEANSLTTALAGVHLDASGTGKARRNQFYMNTWDQTDGNSGFINTSTSNACGNLFIGAVPDPVDAGTSCVVLNQYADLVDSQGTIWNLSNLNVLGGTVKAPAYNSTTDSDGYELSGIPVLTGDSASTYVIAQSDVGSVFLQAGNVPYKARFDSTGVFTSPVVNAGAGYQINGSYGASGQCLTSTGTGSTWGACSGSGGSGTVTSFSAGNLSPLFTSSVATPTTTPALSFSLNTQSANTVLAGPASGASAAPTFRALNIADIPDLSSLYLSLGGGTLTGPLTVNNASGPSQVALTYNSNALTPGSSTTAVYGVNASGQAVASEAGAAASRICTAANGVCTSSMVYPGAGIAVSTGTGWGTSYAGPTGGIVGTTDTQTLTNKTVDGVSPTTFGYLDPTSSVQTQLNAKVATSTTVNGHALSANVTVTASDVGLGNVTNDAQTKAAILPNTAPAAGKVPVGNSGGTAYAPVAISGDCTLAASGALTCTKSAGTAFGTGAFATIANYAPLASPALTGTPTAPTATAGTNTTQVATTAFVQAALPTIVSSLGYTFGDAATGSALTTSEVGYITVPFACTITGWHIMADAGTVTVKVARVNGGTALPTLAANSISTNGVSLATGTKIDSTNVSDFTSTAISANDTLGFFITAVATAKQITFQLDCSH